MTNAPAGPKPNQSMTPLARLARAVTPAPHSAKRRVSVGWVLGWAVATAASLLAFARPATTPVDEDEIYWIGSTYYYHLALVRVAWGHADWNLLPARENPPVAKYVLGLGLATAGQSVTSPDALGAFYLRFAATPGAWGTGAEHAKRAAVVDRVSPELRSKLQSGVNLRLAPELVRPARCAVLAGAIITSLLLLLLGWRMSGPVAGLLASQLILLHPAAIDAYNHAHSDFIALPLATAAAMATYGFFRLATAESSPAPVRLFGTALGAGLLLGLACGAKMNSFVIGVLTGAVLLYSVITTRRRHGSLGWKILPAGGVLFTTALVVFVGINPAVLLDVPGGLRAVVQEHRLTEHIQASFLRGHLVSLPSKAVAVAHLTVFSTAALTLLTLGAGVALVRGRPGLRFAAAWYLLGLLCVTLWIPYSRGRYVLPIILPAGLFLALVAESWIARLTARFPSLGASETGTRP